LKNDSERRPIFSLKSLNYKAWSFKGFS